MVSRISAATARTAAVSRSLRILKRVARKQSRPAKPCAKPTPDPPQMMIKVDQVRRVIETIYYRPSDARERVYIFTDSAFMKEAANSLLKVLEEPPEFATIFLLSENPGELLTTIRSRAMTFPLAALPLEAVERYLAQHRGSGSQRSAPWLRDCPMGLSGERVVLMLRPTWPPEPMRLLFSIPPF
jgi:DNA polymerase III delta prime subunit